MKTFTVEVAQTDIDAAKPIAIRVMIGELTTEDLHQAFARHRIASQTDDLTAASQLEHSGLISREKYNHIVENIRAREKVREAMA